MCRSCIDPFNGKYCQQCETCGHPAHQDNSCGVGVIRHILRIDGTEDYVGCLCKEEMYERYENDKL